MRWADVSARAGRNELPSILFDNFTMLPPEELRKGLADAWTGCEWPGRAADNASWEFLFNQAMSIDNPFGFIDDDGLLHGHDDEDATITLWRGCKPAHREGLSWSSDRDRAKWFATRLISVPDLADSTLYEITIPITLVVAKFDRRDESEHVILVSELLEDDIVKVGLS